MFNLPCVFSRLGYRIAGLPPSIEKELYPDGKPSQISILPSPISIQQTELSTHKPRVSTVNGRGSHITISQRSILSNWLTNHATHPYPEPQEKLELMRLTGLDRHRLNVWLTNHRIRGNYAFRQRRIDPNPLDLINAKNQIRLDQPKPHFIKDAISTENITSSIQAVLSKGGSASLTLSAAGQAIVKPILIEPPQRSTSETEIISQNPSSDQILPIKKKGVDVVEQPNISEPSLDQKKPRKVTPRKTYSYQQTSILMEWLTSHPDNPYPTSAERREMEKLTGLTSAQVRTWFTNNRIRKLNKKVLTFQRTTQTA